MRLIIASLAMALTAMGARADDLAEAKAAFARADKELNATWKRLKIELPEEAFEELQRDQRTWLEHRDYIAEFNMASQEGKPMEDSGYLDTAAGLTEARVDFLKAYRGVGEVGEWGGVWTDSYGGRFEIVERDGIFYFRGGCVRGPTFHVGDIAGVARINRRLARFSDKASAPEKVREAGETWLNFGQRGFELVVTAANTGYYHGARAYFDGRYRRTALLDAKAADAVIKAATAPSE